MRLLLKIIKGTLLGVVIACLLFFLILYSDSNYTSYRIKGVEMKQICLNDSIADSNRMYLLGVDIKPYKKHGIWIGGIPPFSEGSRDSICDFTIESSRGTRINNRFTATRIKTDDKIVNLYGCSDSLYHVLCNMDLSQEIKCLQMGNMHFMWKRANFLLLLTDTTMLPQRVSITFKKHTIIGNVDNTPIYYQLSSQE